MEYINSYNSPIGQMTLSSDGIKLTGLCFTKDKVHHFKETELKVFDETKKWLDEYFSGINPQFTPPIKLTGTPFQLKIFNILKNIPYGETMTYGEIAKITAKGNGVNKMSAQAVGGAVKRNPIMIIIPCHRVIGKSGKLVGYSGGGIKNKRKLLETEGVIL